jgi:hypothetical protein
VLIGVLVLSKLKVLPNQHFQFKKLIFDIWAIASNKIFKLKTLWTWLLIGQEEGL